MNNKEFNIDKELDLQKVPTDENLPITESEDVTEESAEVEEEKEDEIKIPAVPKVFKVASREVNEKIIKSTIADLKKIKIAGIDDKENYEKVKQEVGRLRTTRTTLEKWRKAKSKPLQDYCKKLKGETDKLGELCSEGETYGESLLKPIDDEKERIKKEKDELAQKMIQDRVKELIKYGAEFDGQAYTFPHDSNLHISVFQTEHLDLAEFNDILEDVKAAWVIEEARLAQVEADRIAEENKQKQLIEQNKTLASQLNDKRSLLRKKELRLSGFAENGAIFKLGKTVVTESIINDMSDDLWDEMIASAELGSVEEAPEETPVVQIPRSQTYVGAPVKEVEPPAVESGTASVQGFEIDTDDEDILSQIDDDDEPKIEESPVADPEEIISNDITIPVVFNEEMPFIDLHLSAKFFQRLFPVEYWAKAHEGVTAEIRAVEATQINGLNLYYLLVMNKR